MNQLLTRGTRGNKQFFAQVNFILPFASFCEVLTSESHQKPRPRACASFTGPPRSGRAQEQLAAQARLVGRFPGRRVVPKPFTSEGWERVRRTDSLGNVFAGVERRKGYANLHVRI